MRPTVALLGETGEECVVPSRGALVLRENEKSVSLLDTACKLLLRIAEPVEHGEQAVVILQTPDARKAKEYVLSLEDQSYA